MYEKEKTVKSSESPTSRLSKRGFDEVFDADYRRNFTTRPSNMSNKKAKRSSSVKVKEVASANEHCRTKLLPYPYFSYRNYSTEGDDDPHTPVTLAGHVPSFPMKLHAVLASPDFNRIMAWDDHGRSFRILNLKDFESHVLPKLVGHRTITSFIYQLKLWGFHRMPDEKSYYHEKFLRSMPWLCKKMKRLSFWEKLFDIHTYPDLRLISQEFPVPPRPMNREVQVVIDLIKKGHNTPMPKQWGSKRMSVAFDARHEDDASMDNTKNKSKVAEVYADKMNPLPIQKPIIKMAAASANVLISDLFQDFKDLEAKELARSKVNNFAAEFRAALACDKTLHKLSIEER